MINRNTIKSIPIIGYCARVLATIFRAPKFFDGIRENNDFLLSRITALEEKESSLRNRISELTEKNILLSNTLIAEINDIKTNQYERNFANLISDSKKIKQLNYIFSATPTIWGDDKKLHISDKAAVSSCFFNTNSGSISVGDYSYAGSGVSVLAGSHDIRLKGYLRRDVEYKEGYDIFIGNGVWLASNSTILGPCVIEDDAVVAAGAVVIPGTHIFAGEIYGGVPAKKIGNAKIYQDIIKDKALLTNIINRENGILFYSGWTEKSPNQWNGKMLIGHWNDNEKSIIYTNEKTVSLLIQKRNKDQVLDCHLIWLENGEENSIHVYDEGEITISFKTNDIKKITIISYSSFFASRYD